MGVDDARRCPTARLTCSTRQLRGRGVKVGRRVSFSQRGPYSRATTSPNALITRRARRDPSRAALRARRLSGRPRRDHRRRSENRSFARARQHADRPRRTTSTRRLDRLLSQGASLRRYVFAARLDQLGEALPGWITAADLLRRPKLAHEVNESLYELTLERADAYETLLSEVARRADPPLERRRRADGVRAPRRHSSRRASVGIWSASRCVKEPGHGTSRAQPRRRARHYVPGTADCGALVRSSTRTSCGRSPSPRCASSPAPLPAKAGVLAVAAGHVGASRRLGH